MGAKVRPAPCHAEKEGANDGPQLKFRGFRVEIPFLEADILFA
jgi:hypothetical protein